MITLGVPIAERRRRIERRGRSRNRKSEGEKVVGEDGTKIKGADDLLQQLQHSEVLYLESLRYVPAKHLFCLFLV